MRYKVLFLGGFMDSQLKRGILDVCVLSALKKEESYGYKIITDLSPLFDISESTLYPILKRLESGKFVTTKTVHHNGRLRKYYIITDKGHQKISEFLDDMEEFLKVYKFIKGEVPY